MKRYDKYVKLNDGSYICSGCTIRAVKFYRMWRREGGLGMLITINRIKKEYEKLEKFVEKMIENEGGK